MLTFAWNIAAAGAIDEVHVYVHVLVDVSYHSSSAG